MAKHNCWQINGIPIPPNPGRVLPTVIEFISDLPYWSEEALKELFLGVLEMAIALAKEEKKCRKGAEGAQLTRFINSAPNKIKFIPSQHLSLLRMCYSAILASEGMGTLPGFRMSNKWGDNLTGNPEIESIRRKQKGDTIMAQAELKRSDYLAAAKDLVTSMGLMDDAGKPIAIDGKSNVAQLQEFILSAAENIDPESDEFKPSTLEVLKKVGYTGFGAAPDDTEEVEVVVKEEEKAPAPKKEEKKKAAPADDLAEDDDWQEPEPVEPLTLQEQVATAKRLADLKDLCTGNAEFKKLVPKLKSFQGLSGPRLLKEEMQKIVGVPEAPAKPAKAPKASSGKTGTPGKKPGVIAAIAECISNSGKKGITKAEILTELISQFPERSEDAMKSTINVQIPARISKEKFPIAKTEEGRWYKK
jgi:hypothetical protein